MLSHKPSRLLLIIGSAIGSAFFLTAFLIKTWALLLMAAGLACMVLFFLFAQLFYAVHLFKEDEAERRANMIICPNCEAPIYKEDAICPYCHSQVLK